MDSSIADSLARLKVWIEGQDFRGYDPYDCLNSPFIRSLPLGKYGRTAVTQLNKHSPVNFRKLLGVRKEYNPKGLALFIKSYAAFYEISPGKGLHEKIEELAGKLSELASPGYSGRCWGYNFDWQSRAFFAPKKTPNLICTVFAAEAFLDIYEIFKVDEYLESARSACDFILKDLNISEDKAGRCFSYTPFDRSRIHNANLLAAALFFRVYCITGEERLRDMASKAMVFSVSKQNPDGSLFYGMADNQQWVDNFHTGYNLNALADCSKYGERPDVVKNIKKGFSYYIRNMFYGAVPKYYNNSLYPVDIHSVAQAVLTFLKLGDIKRAKDTALWGINNMQDEKGYFYFQKHKLYMNKIPYIRWGQAWMFYALSSLVTEKIKNEKI